MSDLASNLRTTVERIGAYADGSGYRYVVRVGFDAEKRPMVQIESGGDIVEIEADEWGVVKDAIDRGLQYVGTHPDND